MEQSEISSREYISKLEGQLAETQLEKRQSEEKFESVVRELRGTVILQKEQIASLKRALYGKRSEQRKVLAEEEAKSKQPMLPGLVFDEAPVVEPKAEAVAGPEVSAKPKRARKNRISGMLEGDGKFAAWLPRETKTIDLGESFGEVMTVKVSERLVLQPSQYLVERTERVVRKHIETGRITQPPAPETVLPRCCVDATFLAQIVIMKFMWHLPLYRQEQMLRAQGVYISRDTLIRYVIELSKLVGKLHDALGEEVFSSDHLVADETRILVGKGTRGNKVYTQSYFWPFLGDDQIVFYYAEGRGAKEIDDLLATYKGSMQVDGYAVYELLAERYQEIVLANCWAHARRKFIEAEDGAPEHVQKILEMIQELYQVEAEAQKVGGSLLEARLRLRRVKSQLILDKIKAWLTERSLDPRLLPRSKFAKGIFYALQRWDGLTRFVTDPKLELDTNAIERQIRPIALGRKNYLFCASEVGAEAAAIFYSLIGSCKLKGIEPFDYLVDIFNRIGEHKQTELKEILPKYWQPLAPIPASRFA